MNFESSRLQTFESWPADAPVDRQRIARAGFFYIGQNLEVQCFSCGGKISEWQYGDKVMTKHRLLDPRCPFVLNPVDSGNVPLIETNNHTAAGGSVSQVNKRPHETENNSKSEYRTEAARLVTFNTWPIPSKVEGYRLAKAGFYYLQELDKVRCAFCGIDAYNWEAGDDPIVEHRRHSPTCPFLSNLSVGCSSQQHSNDVLVLRDNYFSFEPEYGLDAHRMKDFGILNHRIPKHSKFMTEESRISSFEKWPKREIIDPLDLARAGFYYTGVEDKVRCYHCGGGLQKWKANDDPWVEHTKWFSNCDFIYLVKGEDFITDVKQACCKKETAFENVGDSIKTAHTPKIDDNVLQMLMTSAPVLSALDLGLDVSRVKQVLRDRLMRHQKGFSSEDELIAAVLDAQFNEPVADLTEESWIDDSFPALPPDGSLPLLEYLMDGSSSSRPSRNLNSVAEHSYHDSIAEPPFVDDDAGGHSDEFSESADEFVESENYSEGENESMIIGTPNDRKSFAEVTLPSTDISDAENKDTQLLEEENRKLKEAKLCKICMDQDVNIVFLPCGHLVTCSACAANIPDCPVCRQMIKGTVRTFLA